MPQAMRSYHPNLRVSREGHVATVVIDRPEAKNACTGEMWVGLGAIFKDLAYSGSRAIVLTGAGGDFCAGADMSGASSSPPGEGGPSTRVIDAMRVLSDVVVAIHDCQVPVVAKVDGICVGGGLGLALAADMIWCSERARFSAIFAKRGLSLDCGTSWLLRQRIGAHRAKEMAFTARVLNAYEAKELGFVNAVVPTEDLDADTAAVVEEIASGPPIAISMMKRQIDHAGQTSLTQALEMEALAQSVNGKTDDVREAMIAYAERRPPNFEGK